MDGVIKTAPEEVNNRLFRTFTFIVTAGNLVQEIHRLQKIIVPEPAPTPAGK